MLLAQAQRIRKRLSALFKDHSLKVATKCNLIKTDFFNVTFNLKLKTYWSLQKPIDNPLYMHMQSNYPSVIKKQLPSMLSNCLCQTLKREIKEIKSSKTLFVPDDKTIYFSKVNTQEYKRLLLDVTASYQKIELTTINKINLEAKIIEKLNFDDRVEAFSEHNAFITLNHKPNFPNSPKCRLINPIKIKSINSAKLYWTILRVSFGSILISTNGIISWFQAIPNKCHSKFMKFDIEDFYPSIS